MNILVLGCRGQLGSELQVLHSLSPHHFTFTDRDELDITDSLALESYLKGNPTHLIINCSAYTQVDQAELDTTAAQLINHDSVAALARLSKQYRVHLIHISTDYVFDGTASAPYSEVSLPNPINNYGQSKYLGELSIQRSGCHYTIIRTSWLYSSFGHNFVKTMLRLQSERSSLSVVSEQVGCPTYARDLARCILHLIERGTPETSELYHYSNDGACSWYEFAQAIAQISGSRCHIQPCATEDYPTPAPRPKYSVLDTSKIRSTLPAPIPHWQTSLKDCLTLLLNP